MMDFHRIWVLRGPNIWSRHTVLEAEIDLQDLSELPPSSIAGFEDRLRTRLPPGLTAAAGLSWMSLLMQLGLELQRRCGCDVVFGTAQEIFREGRSRVVIEYEEERVGQACLEAARDVCLAAVRDTAHDGADMLRRLRDLANEVRLGPSTRAIVEAARRRGIPTRRLGDGSLIVLGFGVLQRRILTAETDDTTAVAQTIAQDKDLTRALLKTAGVPVPEGRPITDAEDAWRAAEELGVPVVVKPRYGNQGRGVVTDLTTREQVFDAYEVARKVSSYLMVERHVTGADYRVLVVGDKVVAAALREPAHVVADGHSTTAQLVEAANRDPRRSDGHATCLSLIKLDDIGLTVLAEQGYLPDSVPEAGKRVLLRRNANLSTGGTAADVTQRVHPRVARCAVDAARAVGLDIAGVDIVADDIARPLDDQNAAIVEVNAGPGLRMHLEPSAGTPRDVGAAIVELVVKKAEGGGRKAEERPSVLHIPPSPLRSAGTLRVPIVAITGVNGKTTTTRLIAHIFKQTGLLVGMTCTDGTFIGGRCTEERDCAGPQSAKNVLLHPSVEVAVLETARGGILREGLGFDLCDVGVVTNIGAGDHFGLRGIETLEDLARVKRTVIEAVAPTGHAALNVDDPLVASMAAHCPGSVIFFSASQERQRLESPRSVTVENNAIVLADRTGQQTLLPLDDVPLTHGGAVSFQVENVLAATAAVWALDLPLHAVRQGLASFIGDVASLPGRFNEFRIGGARVILDYAHNPSAVTALLAALDHFPEPERVAVFSGFDRRDSDVMAMGKMLGCSFDRVILYKDWGHPGRADGELNALLRAGLAKGPRIREVSEVDGEMAAIEQALRDARPDQLILLGVETLEEAIGLVHEYADR